MLKSPFVLSAQNVVSDKVRSIVSRQFGVSIVEKESEVNEIDRRLIQVRKAMHLVRLGAVTNYYAATVEKVTVYCICIKCWRRAERESSCPKSLV
jgi:hypothetical protein